MKRIYAYFISLFLLTALMKVSGQDSIPPYPLKIRIGIDLFGPSYWLYDENKLTVEGFISVDTDSSRAIVLEAGHLDYKYSQYNYEYFCRGNFIKAGMDFNLLDPAIAGNRYFAGIGLRYGISFYEHEAPSLTYDNYWTLSSSSVERTRHTAHFIEASPGIRTWLTSHITIGWAVKLKVLIYSGADKDMRAIQIPGYGNGLKTFSPGINYYLIWNFTYREL